VPTPITLETFERLEIPLTEWNHRGHLTIAWLMLREHPLEQAIDRMRRGLKAFIAHHGIETMATQGYHETLTVAWLRVLHATMAVYGAEEDAEKFLNQHPHVLSKVMLRLFYSRPRMMSEAARYGWVEPDLAPLPRPPRPAEAASEEFDVPLRIAVAGPYSASSAAARAENLAKLNAAAAEVLRRGHVPVVGVNAALAVMHAAGIPDPAERPNSVAKNDAIMAMSMAVISSCNAVLHLASSPGADRERDDVVARGGRVFRSPDEVPIRAQVADMRRD